MQSYHFAFGNCSQPANVAGWGAYQRRATPQIPGVALQGETPMGCSPFLSMAENDRIACAYFSEGLYW